MAQDFWTLAVIDGDGVLTAFETVTDEESWVRSKGRVPVPNGCDLALGRYKLVKLVNGKERFEPVIHEKDAALENQKADETFPRSAIARVVFAIGLKTEPQPADLEAILNWLTTFDGAI